METLPATGPAIDYQPPAATSTTAPAAAPTPTETASETAALPDILAAFDLDNEFQQLSTLAGDAYQGRRTGSAGARAAAQYIAGNFQSLGLRPWSAVGLDDYAQPFTAKGMDSENIVGIVPGSDPEAGYVILGAHYDHLGLDVNGNVFNGADDNAAGVAALLETARIFRQLGLRPRKTVVFASFSGEEEGELGARALGELITSQGLAGSVEMINIDGIGATGGPYFGVWDEGTAASAPLVASLRQAGQLVGAEVQEDGTDIGSDAQAFDWQFGIPAVTVDWSWGQDASLYHPYYHTIYDTPEKIDKSVLATASKVAIAGLWIRAS